jgi:hypothetical protein
MHRSWQELLRDCRCSQPSQWVKEFTASAIIASAFMIMYPNLLALMLPLLLLGCNVIGDDYAGDTAARSCSRAPWVEEPFGETTIAKSGIRLHV